MTTSSTLTDSIPCFTLTGDLTGSLDTQQFLPAVDKYLSGKVINCAVDLSSIHYINNTGIGVLVSLLIKFRSRGGEIVLINPVDHPTKMLAFTKLNNIFTVAADEITARQQLAAAAS